MCSELDKTASAVHIQALPFSGPRLTPRFHSTYRHMYSILIGVLTMYTCENNGIKSDLSIDRIYT